ncbi:cupin domain-containing protein [Deinococcus aluminii]|uniref:Cupin type-2 domain-containing protein n=1 Tax=Deinococcus aluminii TaxID=1656885 RepID=A0ABP9XFP5_9DEIO
MGPKVRSRRSFLKLQDVSYPTHRIGAFRVTTLISGSQTAGAFALLEHVLEVGALGSPPHTHSHEDEWSYVLEGELTVDFGGQAVQASPGELVFKPRRQPHTFLNLGVCRCVFWN